jgi:hypothetical protein
MSRRRLALALWIVLAIVVWNVVFDHLIVVAGRHYIGAAVRAAHEGREYVLAGPWMQAAARDAAGIATSAGIAILLLAWMGLHVAKRSERQRS